MLKQFCVSVIVPFYNAESHIKTCLDALLKQDFTKPFEIIMVDDGSTDISRNIVKMYDFRIFDCTPCHQTPVLRRLGTLG